MPSQSRQALINDLRTARGLLRPDWARRIAAAQALGAQCAGEAVNDLAIVIQEHQHPDLCRAASEALAQIGTPEAVAALITALGHSDAAQRGLAARLLAGLGPQVAGRPLLVAVADPTVAGRDAANGVLQQFGDLTPLLVTALAASDSRVRDLARTRLAAAGEAAAPALIGALGRDDYKAHDAAIALLGGIGMAAAPALVAAARQGGSGTDRRVKALAAIGQPAVGDLMTLMGDADPLVSRSAANALGQMGQPALEPLLAAMTGPDTELATVAAEAAARLGQPAVPELIALLGHESGPVRRLAAAALRKIDSPAAQLLGPALAHWTGAMTPALLVVDANGADGSPTLEAAIAAAPDGSILSLRPGVHTLTAPLVLQRPLTLLGPGAEHCTIACAGEVYVVQVAEGRLAASGITFEHTGQHFASVIEVAGGEIELYRCTCRGGIFDEEFFETLKGDGEPRIRHVQRRFTVHMARFGGNLVSRAMFIPDVLHAGSGLWLHGQARAKVTECHFTGNECDGVGAEGSVQVELVRNQLDGNRIAGITLCENTRGRVTGNDVHHNGEHGIAVRSDVERSTAELVIENNTCRANKGVGIGFWQRASATARGNHCVGGDGQRHGLYASEAARPLIEENRCEGHELGGLAYYKEAAGVARRNTCRGNGFGIGAADESRPVLEDNDCSENAVGIICVGAALPEVRRNTCRSNSEDGIQVTNQTRPTVERNICRDNARFGILYQDSAGGIGRANECMGNLVGIYLHSEVQPSLQDNNCAGNTRGGIVRPSR